MTSCQEFLALFYAVFGAHLAVHGVAVSLSQAEIVNARGGVCRGARLRAVLLSLGQAEIVNARGGVCRGACTGSRRTFRDSSGDVTTGPSGVAFPPPRFRVRGCRLLGSRGGRHASLCRMCSSVATRCPDPSPSVKRSRLGHNFELP